VIIVFKKRYFLRCHLNIFVCNCVLCIIVKFVVLICSQARSKRRVGRVVGGVQSRSRSEGRLETDIGIYHRNTSYKQDDLLSHI